MDKRWDRSLKKSRRAVDAALVARRKLQGRVREEWQRQLDVRDQVTKELEELRRQPKTAAQAKRLKAVEAMLKELEIQGFLGVLTDV